MANDELLRKLNEVEIEISKKYNDRLKEMVEELIPSHDKYGLVHVIYKDYPRAIISVNEDEQSIYIFRTNSREIWDYFVNLKYVDNNKVVSVVNATFSTEPPQFDLTDEQISELKSYYEDAEYVKLRNALMK